MLKYNIPLIMSPECTLLNQAEATSLFFLFYFLQELEHETAAQSYVDFP